MISGNEDGEIDNNMSIKYNGYSLIGVSYAFSERHKDGAERKEDIKGNHSKAPQVL